jgi:hypothetical protein
VVAAVAGGLLVLVAASSVTLTLIVSRPVNSRLTRWVDRMVDWAYQQVVVHVADARRRDQLALMIHADRPLAWDGLRGT